MPQRGVSRRVSVRFDEVDEEGAIAPEVANRLDPEPPLQSGTLQTDVAEATQPAEPPLVEVERVDLDRSRANLLKDAWEQTNGTEPETSPAAPPTPAPPAD